MFIHIHYIESISFQGVTLEGDLRTKWKLCVPIALDERLQPRPLLDVFRQVSIHLAVGVAADPLAAELAVGLPLVGVVEFVPLPGEGGSRRLDHVRGSAFAQS